MLGYFLKWSIINLIAYTDFRNIPRMLLFVDFLKRLDTIECYFVQETLLSFGFGPSFVNWINIFYCDIQICVINSGWSGFFFELVRRVRQSCPLSPYILWLLLLAKILRLREYQ